MAESKKRFHDGEDGDECHEHVEEERHHGGKADFRIIRSSYKDILQGNKAASVQSRKNSCGKSHAEGRAQRRCHFVNTCRGSRLFFRYVG